MIRYRLVNSSKKISEDDIIRIEKNLELTFPLDLKLLYLKYNGGEVEGNRSVFLDKKGNEYSMKYLMPLIYKRFKGDQLLEESTVFFVEEKNLIPKRFLIFSLDWGGFPYCYDLNTGSIYFANIEHYNYSKEVIEFVASSLDEFINGMLTEEEAYG